MPKITKMYAFVAIDKDENDEGIVGTNLGGQWMPLVGADMARVASLRPLAQQIATTTGKTIKLITFEMRTDLEVIKPETRNQN